MKYPQVKQDTDVKLKMNVRKFLVAGNKFTQKKQIKVSLGTGNLIELLKSSNQSSSSI